TIAGKLTTPDILISVEPIIRKGSKFKPVTKRITGAELAAGLRTTFPLGSFDTTEHLGVFICRDRKKSNTCSDKAIYSFEQIDRSIRKSGSQRVRSADKVYFFQYLLAKQNKITF